MNRSILGYLSAAVGFAPVILSFVYDSGFVLPLILMGCCWLVFEIVTSITLRKQLNNTQYIKLKSYQWLYAILPSIWLVYLDYDEIETVLVLILIVIWLVTTVLSVLRTCRKVYKINSDGVFDLVHDKQLIQPQNITAIRITESEIAIDTRQYRNDLQISTSNLVSPEWNELTARFAELESIWSGENESGEVDGY